MRTVAQTLGGIAVFRFGLLKIIFLKITYEELEQKNSITMIVFPRVIQVLWSLEIAETHVGRSHSAVYNVSRQKNVNEQMFEEELYAGVLCRPDCASVARSHH